MNYWQALPVAGAVGVAVLKQIFFRGLTLEMVGQWMLMIAGWFLGWLLAELDQLFYTTMCNPEEASCQTVKKEIKEMNWKNAWGLLQSTQGERVRMPVKNVLTLGVVAALGLWLISSNGSFLAAGVVFGLTVRLWSEMLEEKEYKKWYWVFDREFSLTEHKIAVALGGIAAAVQFLMLINK